ncbi:unnamed protein product [Malus baccata var. baccata]
MSNEELSYDFSPVIKAYKDGRVERPLGEPQFLHQHNPKPECNRKTLSSPNNQQYLLAPEHPVPAAYDNSWAALKWVAYHFDGKRKGGEEEDEDWITSYADSQHVFFAGDSARANIAHHMGLRVGSEGLLGVKLIGIVLVHPYFWGSELIGVELNAPATIREFLAAMLRFVYPVSNGSDDPLMNPEKDPKLGELGCGKVVVFVAEKDVLRRSGGDGSKRGGALFPFSRSNL